MVRMLSAAAALAVAGAAFAGPNFNLGWVAVDNSVGGSGLPTTNDPSWMAGSVTYDLVLTFDAGTTINGINLGVPGQDPNNPNSDPNFLYISNGGSNVYQNAAGGNTSPNAVFVPIPGFEGLMFDSYVGLGTASPGTGDVGFAAAMNWADGAGAGDDRIRGTWFVSPGASSDVDGDGSILLMRLTVKDPDTKIGGLGSQLTIGWQDQAGAPQETTLAISSVPTPGAIALFATAGFAAARRRRA